MVLKYIAEARKASGYSSMMINLKNLLKRANGEVDLNVFNDDLVPNTEIDIKSEIWDVCTHFC